MRDRLTQVVVLLRVMSPARNNCQVHYMKTKIPGSKYISDRRSIFSQQVYEKDRGKIAGVGRSEVPDRDRKGQRNG